MKQSNRGIIIAYKYKMRLKDKNMLIKIVFDIKMGS